MKVIVTDIHSNLHALNVLEAYLHRTGFTEVISLGDQVGYNAFPNEVLDKLASWKETGISLRMLMGNHEAAILGLEDMRDYNPQALAQILWTRKVLGTRVSELSDLPYMIKEDRIWYTHGAPEFAEEFPYILGMWDARNYLERLTDNFDVCFFGHTHDAVGYKKKPFGDGRAKTVSFYQHGWIPLEPDCRYLINPGSLGQPRDGDPRASFMLFDETLMRVRWVRLVYDTKGAGEAITNAGLPQRLADRLQVGH